MAGGTWSQTDKPVLPGFYMAFQAAAAAAVQPGARGTVAIPVRAHWGPVRQFAEIADEAGLIDAYTQEGGGGASAYTAVRLALLGGARKVLAYRLADGSEAAAIGTLQDTAESPAEVLKITAKYPGERGNAFQTRRKKT